MTGLLGRVGRWCARSAAILRRVVAATVAIAICVPPAQAATIHIDDVEFFLSDYLITSATGNNLGSASLIREIGTGCISGGNSLVVRILRSGGPPLNYDVHVFNVARVYSPMDDDLATSTFSWDFFVKAVAVLDIAGFQLMARQGTAEYLLAGAFEPPSNNICHRWTGTVSLGQFFLVSGSGSNGNQLDLRAGAAPIQFGWRVFQFANPWPASDARPKISNVHFTIVTNHAPVVAAIADQTIEEGDTLTVAPTGTDSDGDGLTWSGSNLPSGASVNETSGVLTWTPASGQAGVYDNVTLVATDGKGAVGSAAFRITVGVPSLVPEAGSPASTSRAFMVRAMGQNPFHSGVAFSVETGHAETVTVSVHDVAGRLVVTLDPVETTRVPTLIRWDGADEAGVPVPDGRYFVRCQSASGVGTAAVTKLAR